MTRVTNSRPVSHYFTGDALDGDDDDHKEFLLDMIERQTRKRITSTMLVYRYDELNKVNFHKYIDNKEQLVVIIKLINGNVLAAWV